ncbi:Rrf2 family transcriptional regulator [Methylocystis echinoides]|uniref:Rrf2 family transcriptional regulator n=1 Tax=Methylocystis echinoides TaxID=29468 RepID=UPI00343BC11C
MLTKKAKYALKALIYLARFRPGDAVAIEEIAVAQDVPRKFLSAILCELRNAGLVESKKGKGGGYTLARPATAISVGAVVRVIDGTLAPIRCAGQKGFQPCDDCREPERCAIRMVMLDAKRALANVLDNFTLAAMIAAPAADGPLINMSDAAAPIVRRLRA